MRKTNKEVSVAIMCELFGKSKQAFYQKERRVFINQAEQSLVLDAVQRIRKKMPRIGARKLIVKLLALGIALGRDALFELLRDNHLLIRRKRTGVRTTHSYHQFRKYSNLIKGIKVTGPGQLWVSDITYVETDQGFVYLFLITDAYSRKIIGFKVAPTLEVKNAIEALQMALQGMDKPLEKLIHHSDRGIQYCSPKYVSLLENDQIRISMTENGDPLENAIAERVNGILKVEWIYDQKFKNYSQAQGYIHQIIAIYNSERPHSSIDMLVPDQAHQQCGELQRKWKNYYPQKMASF